jgi:hypothetical protein
MLTCTLHLLVLSFISLFITEAPGWRRIPEELRTQLSDNQERGKKTSIEMKTTAIPAVSFQGGILKASLGFIN